MVSSKATTVAAYLSTLPTDRRKALARVRAVVREHLPKGFDEGMLYGMIAWFIPLSRFPDTYNGQPLMVAGLASQKQAMSLHLVGLYGDEKERARFEKAYAAAGKKLDMGKACVRFKKLEDLPLDVVGAAIARVTPERFIAAHERRNAVP